QRVVAPGIGLRQFDVDRHLLALVEMLESLHLAALGRDDVDLGLVFLERAQRFEQLRLLEAVGGEDGDALSGEMAHGWLLWEGADTLAVAALTSREETVGLASSADAVIAGWPRHRPQCTRAEKSAYLRRGSAARMAQIPPRPATQADSGTPTNDGPPASSAYSTAATTSRPTPRIAATMRRCSALSVWVIST